MTAQSTFQAAIAHSAAGRLDQAEALYRRLLADEPENAQAHYNLANLLARSNRAADAVTHYRRALAAQPDLHQAWNNLGLLLQQSNQLDDALDALTHAAAADPAHAMSLFKLGNELFTQRRFAQAEQAFRRVTEIRPDAPLAHAHLAQALLLRGDYPNGFRENEWRPRDTTSTPPITPDRWDGRDLGGQPLLLYAEQGFGDTIQFVRYVPLVLQRNARPILQCRPELHALFKSIPGVVRVINPADSAPEAKFRCPLLSLPLIFNTTLQTIPAIVPYLTADSVKAAHWRRRLRTPGKKIGLVWAGGQVSNPLATTGIRPLFRLAEIPNIQWIGLQLGPRAADARDWPAPMLDPSADLHDFADTAALISNLDLVITVDTAVAHLAGALAKPVLTLLPYLSDWRWLLDRPDSPWYPTLRLFRQQEPSDWAPPVAQIADYLKVFAPTK